VTLSAAVAYLANTLEYLDDFLEIPDMEDRQDKAHVSKMTVAVLQRLSTGIANVGLGRDAHAPIERTIFGNGTSSSGSSLVEIEEAAIDEFNCGLVYDVLIRPAAVRMFL
jgi:hypothetical protein